MRWKRKNLLFITVCSVICIYCLLRYIGSSAQTNINIENTKTTHPNLNFRKKDVKRILSWTQFLSSDSALNGAKECLQNCKAKCEITSDKTDLKNVDAVEFHLSDLWAKVWSIGTRSVIEFPEYRRPDQVWVVSNMEPPAHLWGDLAVFNGLFNMTKWYRQDADISWPYGVKYTLNDTEQKYAIAKNRNRNYHREKTKAIAARISNCFDPGQRYRVIEEINKHIEVDKYGLCYNNPCGDPKNSEDKTCAILLEEYRFYLALENDQCVDYVTEKYWYTLKRDQIPIVNWKGLDLSLVIPNTYINIYDFDSVESAVKYIKKVNENETLYNSYFEYKKYYTDRSTTCNTCMLCHALHDENRPAQIYTDFDAWVRNDTCEKVGIWNNLMKNVYGWIFTIFGI